MQRQSFEVAVVGGGSSGAVVAARLADAGVNVVLIEAGPDYGPFHDGQWPPEILDAAALATTHDWGYSSEQPPDRAPWTWERARILGGCSAHNGAIAAVGHHSDYDAWSLPGWSTEHLRPFFATALEQMRVRTYGSEEATAFHSRCVEAARSAGWYIASDLCDLDANESFGLETVNVVDGIRWNTAFAYIDPVRASGCLVIEANQLVNKISGGSQGWAVTVGPSNTNVEATREILADVVVLAAGVYGTPAILQRSGIGDPDHLRSVGITPTVESALVGTNLHDHPMINTGRDLTRTLQAEIQEAIASGFVPEEQTLGKACSRLAEHGIFDLHLFPVCASTQTELTAGRGLVEVACMTPKSRGSVRVLSADPTTAPHIDHGYLNDADGHDIAVLQDGLAMAEDLLSQPSLAEVLVPGRPREVTAESIRRDVQHYYHPVGTTPMGLDSASSVCDAMGRVRGAEGLVVADVSLMPQIPRANTNIPAVMIGERIADFML